MSWNSEKQAQHNITVHELQQDVMRNTEED